MSVTARFKEIVPIDNPSGQEAGIRQFILGCLEDMDIIDCNVDAGGNLFARVPGDTSKPVWMLSAHMDSVPPCEGIVPIEDFHRDNKRPIIRSEGRTVLGADDKSGIATILEIVSQLSVHGFKTNHPLELFFSTREEVGLLGAKEFDMAQSRAIGCYVLDGEGRVGAIFNAGPSQENMEIECFGRASHAGIDPENGISAIAMGAALCAKLPSGRHSETLTSNIGVLQGGEAMNVTAPYLKIRAEARSHNEPELEGMMDEYNAICTDVQERFAGSTVMMKRIRKYNHFKVSPTHAMIARVEEACRAMNIIPAVLPMNIGSDAHILNQHDIPTVVLGMGFHFSHSLGEFIYVEELEQVCALVLQLVR